MSCVLLSSNTIPDVSLLGGKGANLVRLLQLGCLIPPCIVITTETSQNQNNLPTLLALWKENGFTYAAVRSSATAEDAATQSFAGMFSTFLYVTLEGLSEKIELCQESVQLPRVVDYLKRNNIPEEQVKMAVLVQKMVNSEISGVCFTKNPLSGNTDEIVIEAIFGQGELLVSGQVTPDSYTVSKQSERIVLKQVLEQEAILTQERHSILPLERAKGQQQKLSDIQILLLATQAMKIEKAYGCPVDIEWAIEKGKLYFLQVRPVTT